MDIKPNFKWSDLVQIAQADPYRPDTMTFDQFRSRMFADPFGVMEQRFNFIIDFSLDSFIYKNLYTIPSGSIIKHVGLFVGVPVTAGGTSVNLGLGDHSGSPVSTYGFCALTTKSNSSKLFTPTVLTSDTPFDLCAVTTDGSALGNTPITAGRIGLFLTIDTPAPLNLLG